MKKHLVLNCLWLFTLMVVACGRQAEPATNESLSSGNNTGMAAEAKAYPEYLRHGLMPLRADRWEAIPEGRRQEFSFNTVRFPFQEPQDPQQTDPAAWEDVPGGLHAAFVSVDRRFPKHAPPDETSGIRAWLSGWRGERVSAQILLWSAETVSQVRWSVEPGVAGEGLP